MKTLLLKIRKNFSLFIFALLFLGITTGKAQFSDLVDFKGSNGSMPHGGLTISGSTMYGMTNSGGANGKGCIFSIGTDGKGYTDLYDFSGGKGGATPDGTLLLSGGVLYGISQLGGTNGVGNIFSFTLNGNTYTDLLDFTGTGAGTTPNAKYPQGSLTLSGGVLYGTSIFGSPVNNNGNVFSVNLNGTGYKDLIDFTGSNGLNPTGSITISGSTIYGTASKGGANGDGCLFSYNTSNSTYTDLYDFNGTKGMTPNASLTLSGSMLYGTASTGGANGDGCVFSFNLNNSTYADIYDFAGANGSTPKGTLTLVNNVLYGMTSAGGAKGNGCVFSMTTSGGAYADLFDFDGTHGATPLGEIIVSGNTVFGMTSAGGASSDGLVFSLGGISTSIDAYSEAANSVLLYPNPCTGIFNLQLKNRLNLTSLAKIDIYNVLGQNVYTSLLDFNQNDQQINFSGNPAGYYNFIITSTVGVIGKGKFILK